MTTDSFAHSEGQPEPVGVARQVANVSLVAMFLITLSLPLSMVTRQDQAASIEETEQRRASEFPEVKMKSVGPLSLPKKHSVKTFPRQFERWFGDHLGFRGQLLQRYQEARLAGWTSEVSSKFAVGESPHAEVILGRDGWLFFTGSRVMEDYRRINPFSPEELRQWTEALEARRRWLEAQGIRYLVVITPNKHSIYTEYLPRSLKQADVPSRSDQLTTALREQTAVSVIDLRASLRAAKAHHKVYYQTDTHWNEIGAHYGYEAIMHTLGDWFPEIKPMTLSDFDAEWREFPSGDLSRMLMSPTKFQETAPVLRHRVGLQAVRDRQNETLFDTPYRRAWNPSALTGNAIILHDSFFEFLVSHLSEHFRETEFLRTQVFHADYIVEKQPAVVIEQFVERRLMHELPVNPESVQRTLREESRQPRSRIARRKTGLSPSAQ